MRDLIKWVRLQLDPKAAKDTEDGAKKALGGVDGAVGKLKGAAVKLGLALAAAFSVRAILNFGKAAVAAARESERQYADLASTVDATGGSYADLESQILATADAFEQATIHDDGEYAQGLQRVIALSGDVEASMANMGLVTDVAARFFRGELAPASDLVAKAMTGNFIALQKMGIQATSAQNALDILASRSMNAAADRAATLDGRIRQLNNAWGNFVKEVGFVILGSEGAKTAVGAMSALVRVLRRRLEENKGTLQSWVTRGINVAIVAADTLYRALKSIVLLVSGGMKTSIGAALGIFIGLGSVINLVTKASIGLWMALGQTERAIKATVQATEFDEAAAALIRYKDALISAGGEEVAAALRLLAAPVFTPATFGTDRDHPGVPGTGDRPRVSANAEEAERTGGKFDAVTAAIERFGIASADARRLQALLGKDFDALGAEAANLGTAITELITAGLDPQDEVLVALRDRYREVTDEMEAMAEVTALETTAIEAQAFAASELASALGAAMAGGLGPFAKQKAKQNLLEAAEMAIRAIAAVLTGGPLGAARAAKFAGLAKQHAALAAGWGALGAGAGGGGSSGSIGGSGGGLSPSVARDTSAGGSQSSQPMGADIKIYLNGAGFHALNPVVQRVVQGAMQEGNGRQGNVRVRVTQASGG